MQTHYYHVTYRIEVSVTRQFWVTQVDPLFLPEDQAIL